MEIGPIWRSMLRNKGGFILIAVQIAVTMTIMVNAVAIIQERSVDMARPSGLDEANTFALASVSFVDGIDKKRLIDEDLDLIRNTAGVVSATSSNSFPLRRGGWSEGVSLEPGEGVSDSSTALYFSDEHTMETFALELIEGNNFTPNQVSWVVRESNDWPPVAIVTEALAKDLFPDEAGTYLGKTFYVGDDNPVNIIGVVERLQAPWPSWSGLERSMLVPQRRDDDFVRYIIRTEPGFRDQLMPQIEELLATSNPDRIIQSVRTMDDVRKMAYLGEAAMIKLLSFVVALLTVITGLGIVGLASFNVSRRTRQIGIRRALGATRVSIVRHFMVENFLVSTIGVAMGGILAVALNMLLVEKFALEPMAWYVIPSAMVSLWLVGQAAVAGPARRASNVTPAIATRSI
ncbi:MAG: FtsX-like permease family protein [Gammaproteobacteria bacterium]|nr:FtsX-like permease family protein [Gammaproteobacteria bacterium]